MKTVAKLVVLLLIVGTVGIGLGLLALRGMWFNAYLRTWMEEDLSGRLGMPVQIGDLRGNPFRRLRLVEVRVGEGAEPLLTLDALEAQYRLRPLLSGKVVVDTVRLTSPKILLRAGEDGTWNLPEAPSSGGGGRPWWEASPALEIRAACVEVMDGEVSVRAPDFADRLREVNLTLGFQADAAGYALKLHRFRSMLFDPPLVISNLTALTLLRGGRLTLKGLQAHTPASHLYVEGAVTGLSDPTFDLSLLADSLAFEEVARLFPGTYPAGKLRAEGTVVGTLDHLRADLRLKLGSASGRVRGVADLTREAATYEARVDVEGVDLAEMMPAWGVDTRFDAQAYLRGQGGDASGAQGEMTASIRRARVSGMEVDTIGLSARFGGGTVTADLKARGVAGEVAGDLRLDFGGELPLYDLTARVRHLDLSRAPEGPEVPTDMTGEVRIRRLGVDAWAGEAIFDTLTVGGYRTTRASLRGALRDGEVRLERLSCDLPDGYGAVQGHGWVDLGRLWTPGKGRPAYQLDMALAGLDLERLTGDARLGGPVSVRGRLLGEGTASDSVSAALLLEAESPSFMGVGLDSAGAKVSLHGGRIALDRLLLSNSLATLEGRGSAVLEEGVDFEVTGTIHRSDAVFDLLDVGISGKLVALFGQVRGDWKEPGVVVDVDADSLSYQGVPMLGVSLRARWPVPLGRGVSLRADSLLWAGRALHGFFLDASMSEAGIDFLCGNAPEDMDRIFLWGTAETAGGGYDISLDSLFVQVEQIALSNEGPCRLRYHPADGTVGAQLRLSGPAGRIQARDDPEVPGAVEIHLEDVDIRPWAFLLGMERGVSGVFTGHMGLSGSVDDPQVSGDIRLRNGNVAGFRFEDLAGTLAYGGERTLVDLKLVQTPGREIALKGDLTRHPAAEAADGGGGEGGIDLEVRSEGVDLGFLDAIFPDIRDAAGTLALDVRVGGTLRQPEATGWMRLSDAALHSVPLNQTFKQVRAEVAFAPERVILKRMEASAGEGSFSGTGEVRLNRYDIGGFEFALKASDLEVVGLPEVNAALRADLRLTGDLDAPRLDGEAELTRAEVRLLSLVEAPPDPESIWMTPFFRNLAANVRISASRQVWLREIDMNVEIAGDVDLRKDREGVRLYGSLNSLRGQYEFQNKSFRIERGEIQFQGRPEIDPDLYILGKVRQRLVSGENAMISVIVGGTLLHPQISLESDPDHPMLEVDILSYLVFGRPAQDMTAFLSGQEGEGPSLEAQAAGLVLGVAANRLKQTIGRQLNLDVVEIDMGGGSITRVRVGKYIGPRLFVSYAQGISTTERELAVEYELLPRLTLEAQQQVGGEEQQRDRHEVGLFWKREW